MLAEEYGCLGLILYSDPQDYSMDGVTEFYPDSEFLPETGVQRGTVKDAGGIGDQLTPGYPATGSKAEMHTRYLCQAHVSGFE